MKHISPRTCGLLVVALSFFMLADHLPAEQKTTKVPDFSEVIITTSESHLLLFAELTDSFNDEMLQRVKSGIPIIFTFYIELFQVKDDWFDEKIQEMHFQHLMSYNTLKDMYLIEHEEAGNKVFTFTSLIDSQKKMNEVSGFKVMPMLNLKENENYQIRIRAELHKKDLPMGLHKITPFISWWDLETDWYTVEFRY